MTTVFGEDGERHYGQWMILEEVADLLVIVNLLLRQLIQKAANLS